MNGYQDNSSRKNACRSGMPLMSCPVAGISGNRCINTAPPTCPPEIPCAGSVHPVSENGAFCPQGPEIRPARPYPQTGGNRPPQTSCHRIRAIFLIDCLHLDLLFSHRCLIGFSLIPILNRLDFRVHKRHKF